MYRYWITFRWGNYASSTCWYFDTDEDYAQAVADYAAELQSSDLSGAKVFDMKQQVYLANWGNA
jgi:hypothetical protein